MQFEGRPSRIVVVESDRTVLQLLQLRLEVAGYHVITARNGAAAMEILRNMRPDAVVVELNLPDVHGFEILRALNGQPDRVPTPALVTARNPSADDIRRAISLGARDCMAKPFSGADVLDRVARVLKRGPAAPLRQPLYLDDFEAPAPAVR
jgi:DNA-binding response OmpR family regulator